MLGRVVEVGGLFSARWIGFAGPLSAMLRLPVLTFLVIQIFEAKSDPDNIMSKILLYILV